jgi:hypothetical protein
MATVPAEKKDVLSGFTKLKTAQKKSYDGIQTALTQLLSEIQMAASGSDSRLFVHASFDFPLLILPLRFPFL